MRAQVGLETDIVKRGGYLGAVDCRTAYMRDPPPHPGALRRLRFDVYIAFSCDSSAYSILGPKETRRINHCRQMEVAAA